MCKKWNDIKEKLPKKPKYPCQSYLVWKKAPDGPMNGGIAEVEQFQRDKNCFTNNGFFNYCIITHWMELPKDPETHNKAFNLTKTQDQVNCNMSGQNETA